MTKIIPLTQGQQAIVDDEDYERVSKYKWWTMKCRKSGFYACRTFRKSNNKRASILLHRFIMNPPEKMQVDHVDDNGLNCTRSNMRVCTNAENNRNKKLRPDNTSGYKGVTWDKRNKRWNASITVNGKHLYISQFTNPIDAAHAYDEAAKKYHGKFAKLNFQ